MRLSDRMKNYYEDRTKTFLTRKMITIIRLDGKGFSKLTKNLNKPFDDDFSNAMDATAIYLCENIQGVKFAYTQSDEITLVLTDNDTLESEAWFDYNVQKMVSISASLATAKFNQFRLVKECSDMDGDLREFMISDKNISEFKLGMFDARVFQVPNVDEMVNVMIWRQQDCTRNSLSMAASAVYPHKELEGKSGPNKHDMLMEKGINWNNYKTKYKRGSVIRKHTFFIDGPNGEPVSRSKWVPVETPIFTEEKEFLHLMIPIIEI